MYEKETNFNHEELFRFLSAIIKTVRKMSEKYLPAQYPFAQLSFPFQYRK